MPAHDDAAARPPDDFARFLNLPKPVLLVGGQAVNLWAVYYAQQTRGLEPFVSRDIDVLGDRTTLDSLAQLAGVRPQYFPLKPPSNEIGVLMAHDHKGKPLIIEVLRYVHGVSNEDLQQPAYTFAIGQSHVRVPGPVALLQAKVANVADISQAARQDTRHVLILSRVMPGYLGDLQEAVIKERMHERQLIVVLEQLLGVATSEKAAKVFSSLGIRTLALFDGLCGEKLPRVSRFLRKRLHRVFPE